ncbi:acyl carrier protein [Mycobacterium simiae]|uniref:acyl carrier protein n=1 Tax=Mycobacterium simiae TaxID=1784 RepID=UPI00138CF1AD|nr:acyl carrier protein [Mycobacterium simiae]BBX43981.1 hypothetical protein MSIM_54320 [Mycobacterium simiae]
MRDEDAAAVAMLTQDRREVEDILDAVGELFCQGTHVVWPAVLSGLAARRVGLPTYGFARQRFWLDTDGAASAPVSRAAGLAEELRTLPPDEQHRRLLELVCAHAATVLGHSSGRDIDVDRAFQDFGFESLTGVELRNRLKSATGLALSRTLIFDFPTPSALAAQLRQRLLHGEEAMSGTESDDDEVWATLRRIPLRELRRTGLLDKLLVLAGETEPPLAEVAVDGDVIDSLSTDALIALALESNKTDDIE